MKQISNLEVVNEVDLEEIDGGTICGVQIDTCWPNFCGVDVEKPCVPKAGCVCRSDVPCEKAIPCDKMPPCRPMRAV